MDHQYEEVAIYPELTPLETRPLSTFDQIGILDEPNLDVDAKNRLKEDVLERLTNFVANNSVSLDTDSLIDDLVYSGAISYIGLCNIVLEMKQKFLDYKAEYEEKPSLKAEVFLSLSTRLESLEDSLIHKNNGLITNIYEARSFMRLAPKLDRTLRTIIRDLFNSPLSRTDIANKLLLAVQK